MHLSRAHSKTLFAQVLSYFGIALGSFLAALSVEVFLVPNSLIDGGTVGLAMIGGNIFGMHLLPYFVILLNAPFMYLAWKNIGKVFVMHVLFANIVFFASIVLISNLMPWLIFTGDKLEVVVIGGAILGIGIGLVIRYGGSIDGTEILAIIVHKKTGVTVAQVVLICNIFIFTVCGLVFQDWHPPIYSLITYIVVVKVMDSVIVGLDETKSVLIISEKSRAVADAIIHELGLGLTIMYGRGGYSGEEREILYVIAERLQLAELKELIHREDPSAFIAIENLHEVSTGTQLPSKGKTRVEKLFSNMLELNKGDPKGERMLDGKRI